MSYYCIFSLGTGTLTSVFLERVYQECLTYEGEMDYKTYLDFVLALENRQEPQSLHYFFRILDINGKGYLDTFTLNYFFRVLYFSYVNFPFILILLYRYSHFDLNTDCPIW